MTILNLKKIAVVTSLSVAAVAATTMEASAQGRRNDDRKDQKIERQQDKIDRQQDRIEEQRRKLEAQRMQNNSNRFRVLRNGSYYNTDRRGADLLRQAVQAGYQQGYQAGRNDRTNRRRSSWTTSSVYRSGTFGYQSYVDRSQYQYYFQQGFQRGYQDGFNSQTRYGSFNNGGANILSSILGSILNIQQY